MAPCQGGDCVRIRPHDSAESCGLCHPSPRNTYFQPKPGSVANCECGSSAAAPGSHRPLVGGNGRVKVGGVRWRNRAGESVPTNGRYLPGWRLASAGAGHCRGGAACPLRARGELKRCCVLLAGCRAEPGTTCKAMPGRPGTTCKALPGSARPDQATPAPLACTSAWYDERTIGPEATWLKPSS